MWIKSFLNVIIINFENGYPSLSHLYHFLEYLRPGVLDTHLGYLESPKSVLALSRFYLRVN